MPENMGIAGGGGGGGALYVTGAGFAAGALGGAYTDAGGV